MPKKPPRNEEEKARAKARTKAKARETAHLRQTYLVEQGIKRWPNEQRQAEREALIRGGFIKPRVYRFPGKLPRKDKHGFTKAEITKAYGRSIRFNPNAQPFLTRDMLSEVKLRHIPRDTSIKKVPNPDIGRVVEKKPNTNPVITSISYAKPFTIEPKAKTKRREVLSSPILPKPLPKSPSRRKK